MKAHPSTNTRPRCGVDKRIARSGPRKAARIDLGLEVLRARSLPGARWNYDEIAAWCDCSHTAIRDIELRALRALRQGMAAAMSERELERCQKYFLAPEPSQPPATQPVSAWDNPEPSVEERLSNDL